MAESDQEKRGRGRIKLTPEQRRFLGGAPSRQPEAEQEPPKPEPATPAAEVKSSSPEPTPVSGKHKSRRVRKKWRMSRVLEVQNLALLVGVVILLGATFYVGKKFEYWRYSSRRAERQRSQRK